MPMARMPNDVTNAFCGRWDCAAFTRSKSSVGPVASAGSPRMAAEKSPLPMKKNPAIGITMPMALNAKTRPSIRCSDVVSRKPFLSLVAAAAKRMSAAMPPTIAAASPPLRSGTRSVNLPTMR